ERTRGAHVDQRSGTGTRSKFAPHLSPNRGFRRGRRSRRSLGGGDHPSGSRDLSVGTSGRSNAPKPSGAWLSRVWRLSRTELPTTGLSRTELPTTGSHGTRSWRPCRRRLSLLRVPRGECA